MSARAPRLRVVPRDAASDPVTPVAPVTPVTPLLARDDFELLACVRTGDDSAAMELYDRLRPRVEGTVRRLLGRGDPEIEDVVQGAFVEIVGACDRFRGECSLEAWASSVAAHVVFRHIRGRRRERRIFAPELDVEPPNRTSTSRINATRDTALRVRAHLAEMDEGKAWTFVLHDVCGFDLREISRITEVSVAAAQTRLVRGRREIHERVARDPALKNALEDLEDPS